LLLRKGKKDQSAIAESLEGDVDAAAISSGKAVSYDVIDLAASLQRKKARTCRKNAGKGEQLEKDVVAEVDAAYR